MALKRIRDYPPVASAIGSEMIEAETADGQPIHLTATQIAALASGGGGASSYTIVTEASAFTADPSTHAGLSTYTRAGGSVTFNAAQGYVAGEVYQIRATASLTLVETGLTLAPPYGGTLHLESGMAVQVVMVSPTAGEIIGQTVAAP